MELVPSLLHVGSADMGGTALVVCVFSSSSDKDLVADCALTPYAYLGGSPPLEVSAPLQASR